MSKKINVAPGVPTPRPYELSNSRGLSALAKNAPNRTLATPSQSDGYSIRSSTSGRMVGGGHK